MRALLSEKVVANLLCQQQERLFHRRDHRSGCLRRLRKLRGHVPRLRYHGREIRRLFHERTYER